jgi:peptide/nickel transport system permease protein
MSDFEGTAQPEHPAPSTVGAVGFGMESGSVHDFITDGDILSAEVAAEHGLGPTGGAVSDGGSMFRQMVRVFFQNKLAVISAIYILSLVIMCVVVPYFYASDYWTNAPIETMSSCWNATAAGGLGNAAPSAHNLVGCTGGYDNFGLIFYAGRFSLAIGFLAAAVTMTVGVAYGIFAGFRGGKIDAIMMRIVDVFLAIPFLYLLLLIITIYGQSLWSLVFVIGFTGWFGVSRLMRSEAQVLREREYVQAASSMGATRRRIMWRHILPNGMSTMVTAGTFAVGDAVLALSALGFLGLGLRSPEFDWGTMIQAATQYFEEGYWWTLWPVAAVFILFVLATNYIGDAMRDAFEVRLQER